MRFLFIVQGEGRGHMTQAIALAQKLESRGHQLVAVCVGKSPRREIPSFFHQKILAPIYLFESPNFVTDDQQKSVLIWRTISHNLRNAGSFLDSLRTVDEQVRKYQPDVILNFYDVLAGIYSLIYKPNAQFWTIGHQYLVDHPDFPFAPNQPTDKWLFRLHTRLTSLGAAKRLALSFRPLSNITRSSIHVLPPLLRKEIREMIPGSEGFYLCYMVNSGYGEDLIAFAKANPSISIVAFWDQKSKPEGYQPLPNIKFHQLQDRLFLEKMASCRGLITTAGFESVCEAMYFGKPAMMVPVAKQYEQACNALDAEISGAGIRSIDFDLKKLIKFTDQHPQPRKNFKDWFDQFDQLFFDLLETPSPPSKTKMDQEREKIA